MTALYRTQDAGGTPRIDMRRASAHVSYVTILYQRHGVLRLLSAAPASLPSRS